MTTASQSHPQVSLYAMLNAELGQRLPVSRFAGETLVKIGRILEEMVATEQMPALFMTGYAAAEYWTQTRHSPSVEHFCVASSHNLATVPDEWLMVMLADPCAVLIVGREVETSNIYDAVWTLDTETIERALGMIETMIAQRCPEKLVNFRKARKLYPLRSPNLAFASRMTSVLIQALSSQIENAHRALGQREAHFHHIVDTLQEQVHITEISKRQIAHSYLSPNIAPLTGYTLDELMRGEEALFDGFWLRRIVHPYDQSVVDTHLRRLLSGEDSVIECRILRKDGTIKWILDRAHAAFEEGTNYWTIYGACSDIDERKRYEASLREHEMLQLDLKKERELNRSRREFMSTVSHEFRTPLSMILSSSELLVHHDARFNNEERKMRLRGIIQHVQHLTSVLDDISTIITTEVGQVEFHPRPIHLYALCEEIIAGVEAADGARHPITLQQTHDTNGLHLDPKLVRHILTNLISNATKYSEPGKAIHCEIEVHQTYVVIHVVDHGMGIPESDLGRIFESFQRGANVGDIDGTGLGLKIVRDAVTLHKGFISAQSELGQGSIFSVTLPLL